MIVAVTAEKNDTTVSKLAVNPTKLPTEPHKAMTLVNEIPNKGAANPREATIIILTATNNKLMPRLINIALINGNLNTRFNCLRKEYQLFSRGND